MSNDYRPEQPIAESRNAAITDDSRDVDFSHLNTLPPKKEGFTAYQAARRARARCLGECWECRSAAVPGRSRCDRHAARRRVA
jgi:hypothetical protein